MGIMSPSQLNMYGKAIVGLCKQVLALPEADLPRYPRTKRTVIPAQVPLRLKALKQWRDQKAQELRLDPAIIFSKAILHAIATENPADTETLRQIEGVKDWQVKVFGANILSELEQVQTVTKKGKKTRRRRRGRKNA
jgi:ribonuclease D